MKKRREILDKLGITITKESIKNQAMDKKQMLERRNPYEINKWIADTYGISANEMIDSIIETGDILQIYEFFYLIVDIRKEFGNYNSLKDLGIHDEKIKKFEKAILDSKNAKLIRYCIGFVPGIDLDKYLEALYDTKSYWDIKALSVGRDYIDANEVANPELLKRVKSSGYNDILNKAKQAAKDKKYFPESLKEFEEQKRDLNQLTDKIINSKSPYLICELANYIEHLEEIQDKEKKTLIEKLAKAELLTHDSMGIYEFLSSVESVSQSMFKKMVREIIEIGDEKYMKYVREFTLYRFRIHNKSIDERLKGKEKKKREHTKTILNSFPAHEVEYLITKFRRIGGWSEDAIEKIINNPYEIVWGEEEYVEIGGNIFTLYPVGNRIISTDMWVKLPHDKWRLNTIGKILYEEFEPITIDYADWRDICNSYLSHYQNILDEHWSDKDFTNRIQDLKYRTYKYAKDSKTGKTIVVGFFGANIAYGAGGKYLTNAELYVLPQFRGRGIARELVWQSFTLAYADGIRTFDSLTYRVPNHNPLNFWKKAGAETTELIHIAGDLAEMIKRLEARNENKENVQHLTDRG